MTKFLAVSMAAILASTGVAIAQDAQPNAPTEQRMEQPAPLPNAQTDPAFTPTPSETAPIIGEAPKPSDEWLGRDVYSSDGQNLGDVAALYRDPESQLAEIYVDVGGFLGIGAVRKAIPAAQVESVQEDRIVVKMTEGEVNALPEAQVPNSGNVTK